MRPKRKCTFFDGIDPQRTLHPAPQMGAAMPWWAGGWVKNPRRRRESALL